jgi:phytol kinase
MNWITTDEIWGLLISFGFVFAVIAIATVCGKLFKLRPETTRKIVHIGVGNWILLAPLLFVHWYIAIIGPVCFIIINTLSYYKNIFSAMELQRSNAGTIYYSVALTLIVAFFWLRTDQVYWLRDMRPFAVVGILAMAWGDGMASVFGEKWGKKLAIDFGTTRKSLAGSSAMLIFAFLTIFISTHIFALTNPLFLPGYRLEQNLLYSALTALAATAVEFIPSRGFDNLFVPIISALVYYLLWTGII